MHYCRASRAIGPSQAFESTIAMVIHIFANVLGAPAQLESSVVKVKLSFYRSNIYTSFLRIRWLSIELLPTKRLGIAFPDLSNEMGLEGYCYK